MYSILSTPLTILALASSISACNLVKNVKLTNYGYPDASGIPAYACKNGQPVQPGTATELGDGSFGNPYAAAANGASTVFPKCAKVYVPLLEKYFIIQDDCSGCGATPNTWIDLYLIQSNKNIGQSSCEDAFGTLSYNSGGAYQHGVLVNPGTGYKTNTQPLFQNGVCYNQVSQGRVFPSRDPAAQCSTSASQGDPIVSTVSDTDSQFSNTPPLDNTPGDRNATSTDPAVSKVVPELPGDIPNGTPAPSAASKMRAVRGLEKLRRGRSGYNGVDPDNGLVTRGRSGDNGVDPVE